MTHKGGAIEDLAVFVLTAIILVGGFYGYTFIRAVTFHGQRYDVVVTVQAIEYSTRFGEHTCVWGRVYGDQDITYRLIGHVDLDIGKTYRIVFVDQIWFTPLGFEVRGNVITLEEVVG